MADDGGKNVDNPVSAASSFEQEPSEVNSPAAAAGVASDVDNASQMARMTFARFGREGGGRGGEGERENERGRERERERERERA
eukprot:COSAG03_NODE_1157_length_4692_cov_4.211191_4_plen_84_part_00